MLAHIKIWGYVTASRVPISFLTIFITKCFQLSVKKYYLCKGNLNEF